MAIPCFAGPVAVKKIHLWPLVVLARQFVDRMFQPLDQVCQFIHVHGQVVVANHHEQQVGGKARRTQGQGLVRTKFC